MLMDPVSMFGALMASRSALFSAAKMAVGPFYPLFAIFCIICAALMLIVLTTCLVRQSWNLGFAFLCVWLFRKVLTEVISAVIWSDNADIKLYVYFDILVSCYLFYICLRLT
jgi:hypothetical protein